MTNNVDPDQTPRSAASDLGLHCLQMPVCINTILRVITAFLLFIVNRFECTFCCFFFFFFFFFFLVDWAVKTQHKQNLLFLVKSGFALHVIKPNI